MPCCWRTLKSRRGATPFFPRPPLCDEAWKASNGRRLFSKSSLPLPRARPHARGCQPPPPVAAVGVRQSLPPTAAWRGAGVVSGEGLKLCTSIWQKKGRQARIHVVAPLRLAPPAAPPLSGTLQRRLSFRRPLCRSLQPTPTFHFLPIPKQGGACLWSLPSVPLHKPCSSFARCFFCISRDSHGPSFPFRPPPGRQSVIPLGNLSGCPAPRLCSCGLA